MKIYLIKYFLVVSLILTGILFSFSSFSQKSTIKGKVTEQDSNEPIPFVNIEVKDQKKGTLTDLNGDFILELNPGDYNLVFSSIGYEKHLMSISIKTYNTVTLNIVMKPSVQELNLVVVSASKYEQKLEDATNTIEIIKPSSLENKNILTIDRAVESVPGVAIVDNEPQIRGGSGFSSGLGSRVMILIDEIPILRPDAGRPVWNFLPVEDVEQIEVIKGASSVMYGSSALNGAINIRTSYPKEKTLTKVTMHSGIYSVPPRRYNKSWAGFNPVISGTSFLHSKRINNFDYVIGGNFLSNPGYISGPTVDTTGEYNKGEYEKNFRVNFGTRVRSNKIENLTYGINGNCMYSKNTQSFFWMDADTNMFRSYPGAITNFSEYQFYIDPYVKYFGSKGASHAFKNRFYYSNNDANNNQSTMSYFIYNEYAFSKKFSKLKDLVINSGIMNMYSYSFGKVFSGNFGQEGAKSSENLAVNIHVEKKFFNIVTVSGGSRWEYYKLSEFEDNKPIFMAGINLKATKITYVRASFGQGFRFPSIGERYISTYSGSFGIYPNPDLKSETSWNAEVGLKQLFKISKFEGFIDICGFRQEYKNYVEFNAGLWGTNTDFTKNLGYKFLNTADARVLGIDCSIMGEAKFSKDFSMGLLCGYTYSKPVCLEPNEVYYKDPHQSMVFDYAHTSSDTTGYILKYRFEQLAKFDIEFNYKKVTLGGSAKYYGYMRNIDKFFYNFDRPGYFQTGIKQYRQEHNKGTLVYDARISYDTKKHFKFAFIINNLLNTEYSLRPISVEAPRVTSLQIVYKI